MHRAVQIERLDERRADVLRAGYFLQEGDRYHQTRFVGALIFR